MKEDIFHYTNANQTIFTDEKTLLSRDHLLMKCREAEITNLANAIQPLVEKKCGFRLFLTGPRGSGKTISAHYVLDRLKTYSRTVIPVYINCWHYSTPISIYHSIVKTAGWFMPRRGLAKDEVFETIIQLLEKEKRAILIVLDNLDGLFFHKDEYSLDMLSELSKNRMVGLIGISRNPNLLEGRSFSEVEFRPYTLRQLVDILTHKASLCLHPKSYCEDILVRCAQKTEEKGASARMALELLWKSGKLAQRKGKRKIEIEDVEEVVSKSFRKDDVKNLTEEEELILEILKTGEKTSSELYWAFEKKIMRTTRQIRNYISRLKEKDLVETRDMEDGGLIKPRVISIKH